MGVISVKNLLVKVCDDNGEFFDVAELGKYGLL